MNDITITPNRFAIWGDNILHLEQDTLKLIKYGKVIETFDFTISNLTQVIIRADSHEMIGFNENEVVKVSLPTIMHLKDGVITERYSSKGEEI